MVDDIAPGVISREATYQLQPHSDSFPGVISFESIRLLALACLVTAATFAADAPKLPEIPEQPIAKKKELLFADDFEKAELGEVFESRCIHCVFPRAIQPLQG
jgi:hypothetical protein